MNKGRVLKTEEERKKGRKVGRTEGLDERRKSGRKRRRKAGHRGRRERGRVRRRGSEGNQSDRVTHHLITAPVWIRGR